MSIIYILDGFKQYVRGARNTGRGIRNPLTNTPAVYCIASDDTGEIYVGSTSNFPRRISSHYNKLRGNEHTNRKLQNAYNETTDLEILVRSTATFKEAQLLEQQLVNELLPEGRLCNVAVLDVTKPSLGVSNPLSEAHKKAISDYNKNRTVTIETKEKISAIKKAFYQTDAGQKAKEAVLAVKSIPINVDGVQFQSVREASSQLGVHPRTLAQYKPPKE